jgi:hypothetical protein
MRLIGFNFTKIQAEKTKERTDSIKFNSKINIPSIEPLKTDLIKTKEDIVKINFNYILSYEPEFAKIELSGNMLISLDSKITKQVLKGFNDKGTPDDFKIFVLNLILKKVNLKALQLEEELNLPMHLPLISLNKDNLKEKKE